MRRLIVAISAALWVGSAASTADAAKVGDKLYIKAKNTKMLKKPRSSKVVTVLQPGQSVTWRGSVRRSKRWHKVDFKGKQGIVFRSTLSTKQPSMEMTKSGQRVDAMAFASSGAATKALGSGAKTYGDKNNLQSAVRDIEVLEQLAKSIGTRRMARHARKHKLAPNVGAVK